MRVIERSSVIVVDLGLSFASLFLLEERDLVSGRADVVAPSASLFADREGS